MGHPGHLSFGAIRIREPCWVPRGMGRMFIFYIFCLFPSCVLSRCFAQMIREIRKTSETEEEHGKKQLLESPDQQ